WPGPLAELFQRLGGRGSISFRPGGWGFGLKGCLSSQRSSNARRHVCYRSSCDGPRSRLGCLYTRKPAKAGDSWQAYSRPNGLDGIQPELVCDVSYPKAHLPRAFWGRRKMNRLPRSPAIRCLPSAAIANVELCQPPCHSSLPEATSSNE